MDRLRTIFEEEWHRVMERQTGRIVLHGVAREILTRTACRWSDVPLEEADVARLTEELGLMIDQVARFGPANWYAQWRRRGTETWAADLIERVRSGQLAPAPGTALHVFANYTTGGGDRLSPETAAVELINILRPTLAVSRFIVFAAVALHRHPQWREAFAAGQEEDLEPFVQEVRRYFPFFPAVPGRVQEPFAWRGHRFRKNDWVILDLYGTCHDERLFENPDSFRPERFRGWRWEENLNTLVAQGAGRHEDNHRCPGEWSTVEVLKRAVRLLSAAEVSVPMQDLSIPLNRFPTLPRSGMVLARA